MKAEYRMLAGAMKCGGANRPKGPSGFEPCHLPRSYGIKGSAGKISYRLGAGKDVGCIRTRTR